GGEGLGLKAHLGALVLHRREEIREGEHGPLHARRVDAGPLQPTDALRVLPAARASLRVQAPADEVARAADGAIVPEILTHDEPAGPLRLVRLARRLEVGDDAHVHVAAEGVVAD